MEVLSLIRLFWSFPLHKPYISRIHTADKVRWRHSFWGILSLRDPTSPWKFSHHFFARWLGFLVSSQCFNTWGWGKKKPSPTRNDTLWKSNKSLAGKCALNEDVFLIPKWWIFQLRLTFTSGYFVLRPRVFVPGGGDDHRTWYRECWRRLGIGCIWCGFQCGNPDGSAWRMGSQDLEGRGDRITPIKKTIFIAIWKVSHKPILRGLTITMVINHLLTGMILQVVEVFFSQKNQPWRRWERRSGIYRYTSHFLGGEFRPSGVMFGCFLVPGKSRELEVWLPTVWKCYTPEMMEVNSRVGGDVFLVPIDERTEVFLPPQVSILGYVWWFQKSLEVENGPIVKETSLGGWFSESWR